MTGGMQPCRCLPQADASAIDLGRCLRRQALRRDLRGLVCRIDAHPHRARRRCPVLDAQVLQAPLPDACRHSEPAVQTQTVELEVQPLPIQSPEEVNRIRPDPVYRPMGQCTQVLSCCPDSRVRRARHHAAHRLLSTSRRDTGGSRGIRTYFGWRARPAGTRIRRRLPRPRSAAPVARMPASAHPSPEPAGSCAARQGKARAGETRNRPAA